MNKLALILTFAAAGALAACGGSQTTTSSPTSAPMVEETPAPAPTSTVRFVHAAAAPTVDIMAGGDVLLSGVAAGAFNAQRLTVPAGPHSLAVAPAGTTDAVVSADVDLAADGDYTVIVIGDASSVIRATMPSAIVLEDSLAAPAEGMGHIRFVHAVPGGPEVQIRTADGRGFAAGAGYRATTDFVAIAAGQTTLEVVAGADTILSAPIGIADGFLYTVIVAPEGDGVGAIVVSERP